MYIGIHVSIAGGIFNAPANAHAEGAECFQMFTRSPRGGAAGKITPDVIASYKTAMAEHGLSHAYVHAPYYINFASGKAAIRQASARIIREELERSSALGVRALMTHLGSARDVGAIEAVKLTIAGLRQALDGYRGSCQFLIENAAGAGHVIGGSFEEIATILKGVTHPSVGVCLDTCHLFASGYDLRTLATVHKTFADFDRLVGLRRLTVLHANDSKGGFGSRLDRHEHIGKGAIGMAGWRAIIGHPRLRDVDCIIETPDGAARIVDVNTLIKLRDV
ncbi:MAG: deoxyribonuclease IV [Candidatus Kerfeldbacteria bacterium]|nr:deoxyribonuclease IV [Candidatus Kerfeldbacteria bacterium]